MNRIFTDLRNSMGIDRLSSLAILSAHNTTAQLINIDKVIDLFAERGDRRLPLR